MEANWTFSTSAVSPASAMNHISPMAMHTEEQSRTALQKLMLVGEEPRII